jgi:two-component system sensor histidine kinase UhpB
VEFSTNGRLPPLPREANLGLYRIVQEALHNIWKHAEADEVSIDLHENGADVRLRIADNGRGFDRRAASWHPGVGLASMEERARLLGGSFAVRSTPGKGTDVEVTLPSGASHEEA